MREENHVEGGALVVMVLIVAVTALIWGAFWMKDEKARDRVMQSPVTTELERAERTALGVTR